MSVSADCVIVADDLTGACDSALQFRNRGMPALVHINTNADIETEGVHAFSTETRALAGSEAESRISELAHRLNGRPRTVFKKIDSLLRGRPGLEISRALQAFHCDVAVITPAFPELGRRVLQGRLHVEGDASWMPVHVRSIFEEQGLEECHHITPDVLAEALAAGHQYISIDCATAEDLHTIAREASLSERRVLWVGSAGLASALAEILAAGNKQSSPRSISARGPVVFVIGSEHPIAAGQMRELIAAQDVLELNVFDAEEADIRDALHLGRSVLLRVEIKNASSLDLAQLLAESMAEAGALFLSGGDTASLCCRALDVDAIAIEAQIAPGVPWGFIHGGRLDGTAIITKSGAFGERDVLKRVLEFFTCPQA